MLTDDCGEDGMAPPRVVKTTACAPVSNKLPLRRATRPTDSVDGDRRRDFVRLIVQTLDGFGYREAADTLRRESGYVQEPTAVSELREAVMSGDWHAVEALLSSLELRQNINRDAVRFLIRQQKYLELLEKQQVKQALCVLRNEITPLHVDAERLHVLSSCMMCADVANLKESAKWDGANGTSRSVLMEQIQSCISPTVILPPHRLETLIAQAHMFQKNNCLYHNTLDEHMSLVEDHHCDRSLFPCETAAVLTGHTDEVWYVAFSHSGHAVASASKDKSAIIWDLKTYEPLHVMKLHVESVTFVAWSPDDTMLLSCGNDHSLTLWDAISGETEQTLKQHTEPVTACAWLPNNREFVSGGMDKHMYLWDLDGQINHTWSGGRVTDLTISEDGSRMISVCSEKKIRVYDVLSRAELFSIQESENITSVCLSADARFVLVNVSSQEVHMWDLHDRRLLRRYIGQMQGRFVIRSVFGGVNQGFVVSGSEDHLVYCWHRDSAMLLDVLAGHTGTVNSVSWNPKDPCVFVSASDDRTIRIWEAPFRKAQKARQDAN